MKNMCFFAFLRPFLESTRSFGQLSSSFFQISGSNLLFPHSNGKSRIDGLMTKRPIDGPFRFIIFHPFPAFGCKSIIWQSIERTISIADGFQSYQSWGTIGPKKTKIIILSFFHRRFPAIHRIYQLMTKRWLIDEKMEIYVIKKTCVRDKKFNWNPMSGTHQQDLKDSWSVYGGGKGSDTKEIGHQRPQKCQTSVFVKKI